MKKNKANNKNKQNILLLIAIIAVALLIWHLQEPRADQNVARINTTVQKSGTLAPELAGIAGTINGNDVSIGSLVGKKVILVDIWTYSCINCERTLPYITTWYEKYKDHGLAVIGVHAPEFDFEKDYSNVERAVKKWNITYPVVLDNDHATWRAFQNQYWPRKYLIDIDGYIAYDHIGEGGYDETELEIQKLLAERAERLGLKDEMPSAISLVKAPSVDFEGIGTPEIYVGGDLTRGNFGSPEGLPLFQTVTYKPETDHLFNQVYLEGSWHVEKDHVRLDSGHGKVLLQFKAKNANIVAGGSGNVSVLVDGKKKGNVFVTNRDLYPVVMADDYGTQNLELDISGKGFELYTFTFG